MDDISNTSISYQIYDSDEKYNLIILHTFQNFYFNSFARDVYNTI